ncbi:cytidine and deoxycytidylate deaminase zinc-binding region [Parabacteroides merdae CAG:48]|nr:cytidine and deoxycytidylate deaminase zinc-binding region [Parabacteroides merdae CAG:48]
MMDPFNDEYFMKQALVEARSAAEEGEVPVGAVIVCNNQIIARAHNQTERLNDPTAHAEMLAITAAVGVLGAKYLTRSQVSDRMQPLRDGGTMRDVCRSNRMVATKQDRLRSDRRKKRLPAIRTESLTSKSDSQKRGS